MDASETNVYLEYCPIPDYSFSELFKNVAEVDHLELRNSISNELLSGQFLGLGKHLKSLKFRSTDIISINSDAFNGLENLTNLSFVNNHELRRFSGSRR